MKKGFVLQSLICLLAVSCSVHEMETMAPIPSEDDVFFASFESYSEPDTKVYVDNNNTVDGKFMSFWDAEDEISIFNKTTLNQEYIFMGETGDNAGYFKKVSQETGGNPVGYVCAVYPYQESTSLNDSGVLTLTLPDKQTYRERSFGSGANTMVSTISGVGDNLLKFRNVGGYLVFKLYGNDVTVKSIMLEGRNGELLAGKATMTPAVGEIPVIKMAKNAKSSITLNCKNVELGTNADEATLFWMVVPPTEFEQGFTVTVTDADGKVFIKETDLHLTIERNRVSTLAPVEVIPLDPNQVIYYTTSDKSVITPAENANFGASVVSNEYFGMRGVMVFDNNVTKIVNAFKDCETLTGITIPKKVTEIGDFAFAGCESLPGINIPDGVTRIGASAFQGCFVLKNIVLPSSVNYIGSYAFASCHALTAFTIPSKVKSVSDWLFYNCDQLSSINIHEDVEGIGYAAFYKCSSLTEISIPESVTSIGENAFSESGLTNITIPQNVESIGNWAFRDCEQLTSFTILAVTPPVIDYAPATEGLFLNTDNCPIYVPADSFTAYKEADVWSNYASRIHIISPASGEINGHAFVDLGTGLKWGTMNVGAESETEYGNLYAWGKTEPRVFDPDYVYDSSTAFVDVATNEWGQNWRYPTVQEWNSLINLNKFTWTWDSVNKGYWVESKIQGYEGNKIFLPAAGEFGEPEKDNFLAGEEGCYWSSSIGENSGTVWELNFWNVSGEDPEENFVTTYFAGFNGGAGLSVRPVAD